LRAAGARTKQVGCRPILVRFRKRVGFVHRKTAKWPGILQKGHSQNRTSLPPTQAPTSPPPCTSLSSPPPPRRRPSGTSPPPDNDDVVAAAPRPRYRRRRPNTTSDYFVLLVHTVTDIALRTAPRRWTSPTPPTDPLAAPRHSPAAEDLCRPQASPSPHLTICTDRSPKHRTSPSAPSGYARRWLCSIAIPSAHPAPPVCLRDDPAPTQRPLGGCPDTHPAPNPRPSAPRIFFPAAERPWRRRGEERGRKERGGRGGEGGGSVEPTPISAPSAQFLRPSARWVGALGDPAPK
jgi:hypothetical protein